MPLIKSDTEEAISENIKTLKEEGKSQEQAVAIALQVAREVKKRQQNNGKARKTKK